MPIAARRGEWRLEPRHAALALERFDQRRLLATDKRTRALLDAHPAGKAGAEDVVAQKALFLRLADRIAQPLDRKRIFRTHIDNHLGSPNRIGGDQHAFNQVVRVAFDHCAIHKGTGVALIRIANEVFRLGLLFARRIPFKPGGKARAAAPLQAGNLDGFNHILRRHGGERFANGAVAAVREIILDFLRVDHATMPQRDARLLVEKRLVVIRDHKRGQGALIACFHRLCNGRNILFLHAHKPCERAALFINIYNRLEITHADAACDRQLVRCA